MPALSELHRPRCWEDVAGQDKAVRAIRKVLKRGWGGRAWWITGSSGTGKTTIAKLIASEGASELATEEQDAGSLTPARLRELERQYAVRPLPVDGKAGWAIVVNECHKLRKDTVTALLDVLERLPGHACWLFTTTRQGQAKLFDDDKDGDCAPLVSRCVEVELQDTPDSRLALAQRAKAVAELAGCDGIPEPAYLLAVTQCRGNLRAVLQRVEAGTLVSTARAECDAYLQQPLRDQNQQTRQIMQACLAALNEKGD